MRASKRPDPTQKSEQPETKAEPKNISDRFADTSQQFNSAEALKEWQKQQVTDIHGQVQAAITQLKDERRIELKHEEREWAERRSKHDRLLNESRRDVGVPYPSRPEIEA